jgi:carbon storage regulator
MLVLTRQQREELVIAGKVRIHILDIQGGRVRIGVSAPREVTIERKEVHDGRGVPAAARPAA